MRDEKTHGTRATHDSEPKTHLSSLTSHLPTTDHELTLRAHGYRAIAGVDEVGRGSWAGPVVAAAVILPDLTPRALARLDGVRDSKQLTASQRDRLAAEIRAVAAAISIGWATHHVIDREGIAVANRRAMLRAIRGLALPADAVLLDHVRLRECPLPQVSLAHGDALVLSIAAASIIAKVTRDRWMERCALRFSGYGFERHKGYGTAEHRAALTSLGISPIHRRSFSPCSGL